MFAIETFIDQCRSALQSDDPPATVAELLRDALRDRDSVATAVREWRTNGGGAYGAIYRARDLTILHASVTPGFESPRHNHTMWAVIGVYEGQEDNAFYKSSESVIEEVGRAAICAGDAKVLDPDVIHRIANHSATPMQAIHVYGGDLLGTERSMWDDDTGAERRFDFAAPPITTSSN
jgi:predicted metal-dependent enzyme (double-stranded beta helix superfamily)